MPVSSLYPPYVEAGLGERLMAAAERPAYGRHREHQEQKQLPDFLASNSRYAEKVYSSLVEAQKRLSELSRMDLSLEERRIREQLIFPIIHQMIDCYLYFEAEQFLIRYGKFLLPENLSGEEKSDIRQYFDTQRTQSWGYLFHEACGAYDARCVATMLPFTIGYIEMGLFGRFSANGPYRLLPAAPGHKFRIAR